LTACRDVIGESLSESATIFECRQNESEKRNDTVAARITIKAQGEAGNLGWSSIHHNSSRWTLIALRIDSAGKG
jgi:hypothetical protein